MGGPPSEVKMEDEKNVREIFLIFFLTTRTIDANVSLTRHRRRREPRHDGPRGEEVNHQPRGVGRLLCTLPQVTDNTINRRDYDNHLRSA